MEPPTDTYTRTTPVLLSTEQAYSELCVTNHPSGSTNESHWNPYKNSLPSNCSLNSSFGTEEPVLVLGEPQWWLLVPLLGLQLLTILANAVVMVCVRTHRKLKNVFGIYIFSLAWADLAVGLLVMGGMTTYSIPNYWPLGFDMCSLWICIDYPCCTVSMLHLCVIARDRYTALARPLEYKDIATTKNAILQCLASWVGGFAVWVPTIMYIRVTERSILDPFDCYFTSTRPNIIMIQAAVAYYSPVVVMSYYYIICVYLLRKRMAMTADLGTYDKIVRVDGENSMSVSGSTTAQGTRLTAVSTISDEVTNQQGKEAMAGSNPIGQPPSANKNEALTEKEKRERKAGLNRQEQQLRGIRTLGVVIFMFQFCWAPFCAFWPLVAYCPDGCVPLPLYIYSYWMTYVNSTINPLLYFLVNRDFRQALYSLIFRKRKGKK